jgi:thiaminase
LKQYLDSHIHPVLETLSQQPWEDSEFYKEYLAQTYYFVLYSCRMLAMAASLTEPSRKEFYKRALHHISDEAGHENLALADLKKMGGKIEDHPESAVTRSMWESQFYKIQRQPTSLLGYVLALEYVSVRAREVRQRLGKIWGEECVNFARVHADEDPDHVDKAIQQIEALPESERVEIWRNYEQSCRMYSLLLEEARSTVVAREVTREMNRAMTREAKRSNQPEKSPRTRNAS